MPGMSAEPERLFSYTKITISDRRNRLGSDVVDALECLRSWFNINDDEMEILKAATEGVTVASAGKGTAAR